MKKQILLTTLALATAVGATSAQAGNVKIGGKVFFDYSNLSETTAPGAPQLDTTGANVTRTYLTAKKKINKVWSAKVTFDSALNNGHNGKRNEVFLKKAQLTGKFSKAFQVKLGMIDTPWVGYEDKLQQHRYITKSFVDTRGFAHSADAGIGVFGKVDMFSYDVATINGKGYGDTTRTEKTDLEARFGAEPTKGLTVDLGYRTGYLGNFNAGVTEDKNTLTQLLITYGQKGKTSYRVGINAISNKIVDELPGGVPDITVKGTEIWAWVRMDEFGGYIRSESTDYDVVGAPKEKRTILSLDYHAAKDLVISLVNDKSTDINKVAGHETTTTGIFTQYKF